MSGQKQQSSKHVAGRSQHREEETPGKHPQKTATPLRLSSDHTAQSYYARLSQLTTAPVFTTSQQTQKVTHGVCVEGQTHGESSKGQSMQDREGSCAGGVEAATCLLATCEGLLNASSDAWAGNRSATILVLPFLARYEGRRHD